MLGVLGITYSIIPASNLIDKVRARQRSQLSVAMMVDDHVVRNKNPPYRESESSE